MNDAFKRPKVDSVQPSCVTGLTVILISDRVDGCLGLPGCSLLALERSPGPGVAVCAANGGGCEEAWTAGLPDFETKRDTQKNVTVGFLLAATLSFQAAQLPTMGLVLSGLLIPLCTPKLSSLATAMDGAAGET